MLLIWMDWRRLRLEKQLLIATKSLKASEERFRKAYNSAMVGMGIFKLDGTVLSVNRVGAGMLGYEPDELIGKKVSDFMAPEYKQNHIQQIASLPSSSESSYQAERRVIRKDGSEAWVRNSVTFMQPRAKRAITSRSRKKLPSRKKPMIAWRTWPTSIP